jgi:hypothetical protein
VHREAAQGAAQALPEGARHQVLQAEKTKAQRKRCIRKVKKASLRSRPSQLPGNDRRYR